MILSQWSVFPGILSGPDMAMVLPFLYPLLLFLVCLGIYYDATTHGVNCPGLWALVFLLLIDHSPVFGFSGIIAYLFDRIEQSDSEAPVE